MRTCRELGIATVAVYSELDRDAAHVRYADEAYALGGQTAAESYLNTEAILDAIRKSRAPTACTPATASSPRTPTSPGPITDRRRRRGSVRRPKRSRSWATRSRRASRPSARDVESVPGTTTPITDASEIVAFGEEFGYPIAIKAAYGGGGRGMKVVERAEDAESRVRLRRARSAGVLRPARVLPRALPHPARATSSCRSSATRTATASTSATATARRSAGTRS